MAMSSEDSNSSELELSLGLSLGGGNGKAVSDSWDECPTFILTAAEDSSSSSLSSSLSSSKASNSKKNEFCGKKRRAAAEPTSPGRSAVSRQVVGWPPIKPCRKNKLVTHTKVPNDQDLASNVDKCRSMTVTDKTNSCVGSNYKNSTNEKGLNKTSLLVKVNMDGVPIGRKVDLNAHHCYETLSHTLESMFQPCAQRSNVEEQVAMSGTRQPVRLLDGLSEFVLSYVDKEGDWMLVGDVPWQMFVNSVRRLRIQRTTEAKGLGK